MQRLQRCVRRLLAMQLLNPFRVRFGWGLSDGVARGARNPILEICNASGVEFSASISHQDNTNSQ